MNRSQSKFQNTADKMCSALLTLLENKEFTDISIREICEKAGVNRSTFYAHYDNTYDLLQQAYDGLIHNFLVECNFDDPVDLSDMRPLHKEDLNFVTPGYLLPYLRYIKKHRRLVRIYFHNAHTFETGKTDDYLMHNLFVPIYEKYGVTDKKLVRYMQTFFLKGVAAVVNEWVDNDCEDDVLFICEIIMYCIRPLSYKE